MAYNPEKIYCTYYIKMYPSISGYAAIIADDNYDNPILLNMKNYICAY